MRCLNQSERRNVSFNRRGPFVFRIDSILIFNTAVPLPYGTYSIVALLMALMSAIVGSISDQEAFHCKLGYNNYCSIIIIRLEVVYATGGAI